MSAELPAPAKAQQHSFICLHNAEGIFAEAWLYHHLGLQQKKQKIPTVRDWNDAVSADCGCCSTRAIVACAYKQLIHCG